LGFFGSAQVVEENVNMLAEIFAMDVFKPEAMMSVSSAASSLCAWVINIVAYWRVWKDTVPKQNAMAAATAQFDAAQAKLAAVQVCGAPRVSVCALSFSGCLCHRGIRVWFAAFYQFVPTYLFGLGPMFLPFSAPYYLLLALTDSLAHPLLSPHPHPHHLAPRPTPQAMVAEMEAALEALNQGLQDAMDEQVRVSTPSRSWIALSRMILTF
jgi:hypothetical protein